MSQDEKPRPRKESGSAKRRRKAIERREFWTNKKEQQ